MKALILAAGFGTRLRPHTRFRPKPLFTVAQTPLIDRLIRQLHAAGCTRIMVNTHHLNDQIDNHIRLSRYPISVDTRYEPEILGTAGAIRNLADFWDDAPFMVVNGDIVTDLDFSRLYQFHLAHDSPVTMAVIDYPQINSVALDPEGHVARFNNSGKLQSSEKNLLQWRTFSGIQVLNPEILNLIPESGYSHSVDIYLQLISANQPPQTYDMAPHYWMDTGTPQRYRQAVFDQMAAVAFHRTFGKEIDQIDTRQLAGDGSDRRWYRLQGGRYTLIMADHGIHAPAGPSEARSFVSIGRLLKELDVPVPAIHTHDICAGLVFIEDLGDLNLQAFVEQKSDWNQVIPIYHKLIRTIIHYAVHGLDNFDPAWAFDTAAYNRELIVKREGEYFVTAFLNGYLGGNYPESIFHSEFHHLADLIEADGAVGLMHRDMQSRNIMIRRGEPFLIDFQGARPGPVQYDLASLLIDPYVQLPDSLQDVLCRYAANHYHGITGGNLQRFTRGYEACALARNLQILGAFGFLTRVKKKEQFEQYIPAARKSLTTRLQKYDANDFSQLRKIV